MPVLPWGAVGPPYRATVPTVPARKAVRAMLGDVGEEGVGPSFMCWGAEWRAMAAMIRSAAQHDETQNAHTCKGVYWRGMNAACNVSL